jgi:hypothetical protein
VGEETALKKEKEIRYSAVLVNEGNKNIFSTIFKQFK